MVPEHIGVIEIGHKEPVNSNSSDSELIAVALIGYSGDIEHLIPV